MAPDAGWAIDVTGTYLYGAPAAGNKLLGVVSGLDGIKTGYIRASGHNLAASIRRGNRHLIVIVFGGPSRNARDAYVAALAEAYLPDRALTLAYQ